MVAFSHFTPKCHQILTHDLLFHSIVKCMSMYMLLRVLPLAVAVC